MKKIDSLNLVPFIDIILVLLVIVLTTASFIQKDTLRVDIPQVQQTQQNSTINQNDRIITIDKDGALFFDNKSMDIENLRKAVSELPKDTHIVVNGDKKSNFESFISVMEVLENAQFENLYILVDKNS